MPVPPRPTVEYISQTYSHLSGVWNNTHLKWMDIDRYYNRIFPLWQIGQNRPSWLRPAKARSIVDHAQDRLLAHEVSVDVFPRSPSEQHHSDADALENALRALVDTAQLQEISLTWKQAGKHELLYGYAVVEDGLDPRVMTVLNDPEAYDIDDPKHLFPFRQRAPHPARVLLDPRDKSPDEGVKFTTRFRKELRDIVQSRIVKSELTADTEVNREWLDEAENWYQPIPTIEFYSAYWHGMVVHSGVSNKLVFLEPNLWKFFPWSHAFAGYGQEPTDLSLIDPEYIAVGILDHLRETIKAQAQAIAGLHNALIRASFNPMVTTEEPDEIAEQLSESDLLAVQSRNSTGWMEMQQMPRWMFQAVGQLDADLEQGSYARRLTGVKEQGVSTVGQQAILSQAAGQKFVSPILQLEQLATVSLNNQIKLVKALNKPFVIRGHTLRPSMLNGLENNALASFTAVDPVLELQERQLGLQELAAGAISLRTYWARAGVKDSSGEEKRLIRDQVRQDPRVQQLLASGVARELGIEDLLQDLMAGQTSTQQPGQQPLVGPNGQPLDSMSPQGPMQAAQQMQTGTDQLRQPLNGYVANPPRTGANLAAGGP